MTTTSISAVSSAETEDVIEWTLSNAVVIHHGCGSGVLHYCGGFLGHSRLICGRYRAVCRCGAIIPARLKGRWIRQRQSVGPLVSKLPSPQFSVATSYKGP
jgi:hypothetical protein